MLEKRFQMAEQEERFGQMDEVAEIRYWILRLVDRCNILSVFVPEMARRYRQHSPKIPSTCFCSFVGVLLVKPAGLSNFCFVFEHSDFIMLC